MDESNIYANVDAPFGYPSTKRSFSKRLNEDTFQTQETAGPASTGAEGARKRWRNVAVILGLLCVLFLTGLVVLTLQYIKMNPEWRADMALLQNSNNNLTKERDQLLETNSNLTEQRDQLQKRLRDVTQEKSDLFKEFQDWTRRPGWVCFRGSFYYVSSVEKSWQESRADCQSTGADLMIVNSKEEQDFARSFKKRLWIGLSDRQKEGVWKWVDGTGLTRSFWALEEPNGVQNRDEDCAEIKMYESENSWNDDKCEQPSFWICEKKFAS